MTIAAMIEHHAAARPLKPAFILPDRVVTYGMLGQALHCIGTHLAALGLKPGDTAAISVENPARHMILACALLRAGIASISLQKTAPLPFPVSVFLEDRNESLIPGLRQVTVTDAWYSQPREGASLKHAFLPKAICNIAMSSGATGKAKAIALPYRSLEIILRNYSLSLDGGDWKRMLCLPSLTSTWGFRTALHALHAGKTLCFAPSARDALDMISVYTVDCMIASVQHLREMIEDEREAGGFLEPLRLIFTGGSRVSGALLDALHMQFRADVICQYASTEAGAIAFAPAERLRNRDGAVGFVAPWAHVEIVDDSGHIQPRGQTGRLRVRSDCQGHYLDLGDATAGEIFHDGWFYPGDTGYLSEDGMLHIAGRASEVINTGGVKVAPDLVEELLRGHAGVRDVAAFGMMNDLGVEELWVAIVPFGQLEAETILQRAEKSGVVIDRVFAVDAIPRTALGKIAREELKKRSVA